MEIGDTDKGEEGIRECRSAGRLKVYRESRRPFLEEGGLGYKCGGIRCILCANPEIRSSVPYITGAWAAWGSVGRHGAAHCNPPRNPIVYKVGM